MEVQSLQCNSLALYGINLFFQKWLQIYKLFSITICKTFSHDKLDSYHKGAQGPCAEV